MAWLSRWRAANAAKKIIQKVENEFRYLQPVFDLEQGIILASLQCGEEFKASLPKLPLTEYASPAEQKQFEIYTEFVFFFLHFTSRQAYGRLPRVKANSLLQTVGEFVLSSVVDVFMGHWPDDLKKRIQSELYSNLNQSEGEYAQCKELSEPILPPGRIRTKLNDTAMLSRLAFHVLSKARKEGEIDPKQIDTETAVLADLIQTVVTTKLVDGNVPGNAGLPDIHGGTLKELGLLVDRAGAALEAYERDGKSLQQAQREAREAFLKEMENRRSANLNE
jgi:hypothetical protein